jgi:hypothetical protein
MAQPYNYSLNLPDPTQSVMGAIQLGGMGLQVQQAKQQLKQAEVAAAQQAAMQDDLFRASENPNPASVAQLIVRYPQLSEHLKRGYDALNTEQQKSRVDQASQVYASLLAGDTDTAATTLRGFAEAYRNSGMEQDAKAAEALARVIELNPQQAQTTVGLSLATAMGPDKFQETFAKLESERRERALEPSKLTEAQAKAREAAVKAEFAESNAVADLEKKGWDIYKIQEDAKIARENARIAAMNAELNRETNQLKRDELQLKVDEAKLKRDQEIRDRVASVENARTAIDNALNTIDRVLVNPSLNDVLGSLEGGIFGTVKNILDDDAANAVADIETIKSQTFLNQLQALKNASTTGASGLGGLSEKEGERLMNAVQSLSRKQSEVQFTTNLKEMQRLLLKNRKVLSEKYGMPDTLPDTPNVQTDAGDIDSLVRQYAGG